MNKKHSRQFAKSPTGIDGFDEITYGGLPTGRVTLLAAGPGAGKTIFSLQTLVNGACLYNEPGIFVAFEENSKSIITNAATFGWDLPALERDKLFFLDAKHKPDQVQSGNFDLSGMLAVLAEKAKKMRAKRIVFDSVDVLLELLDNPQVKQRELYRLHEWLLEQGLTAIITSKVFGEKAGAPDQQPLGFMQFMVDCVVVMNHDLVQGVSQRNLRVVKYRGSSFAENESPLVIGESGIEVAGERKFSYEPLKATNTRVSTGSTRLDTMLGGGYYRAANVLITGSPGTAKTTLTGAFAEAACGRGERTVFVSYDSKPEEIVRNLSSVNIRLDRFVKNGMLKFEFARTGDCSSEIHLMRIKKAVRQHKARNLVIDPVSALCKQGNELTGHSVVERMTAWAKDENITLVFSSLLATSAPDMEGTPLQISTIADTWIHLSYIVHAGERNRALTVVKSRGTAHSNQVREMILSDKGVTLEDVYNAGGEVLMGTMRWEKEQSEKAEQHLKKIEVHHKLELIKLEEAGLLGRMQAVERELAAKRMERDSFNTDEKLRQSGLKTHRFVMRGKRSADLEKTEGKAGKQ